MFTETNLLIKMALPSPAASDIVEHSSPLSGLGRSHENFDGAVAILFFSVALGCILRKIGAKIGQHATG